MKIREAMDYLSFLDAVGGPEPEAHGRADATFSTIMSAFRAGMLTHADLERVWAAMPNAFGVDTLMGHGLRKPYGYAGDFEMIDRIYLGTVTENPQGRRWDEYFQSRPACTAVRNRRDYFVDQLDACAHPGRKVAVLNVASGPARDVAEFLGGRDSVRSIEIDCVDLDAAAIAHAEQVCRPYTGAVRFQHANIFRWRADRSYDLIWSAGLFDYLDDRAFATLLKQLSALLTPGGRMVVGNFSPANPTRDFMEFGEWFLNHRDEDQLMTLGAESGCDNGQVWIAREPCGINLFLNVQMGDRVPAASTSDFA